MRRHWSTRLLGLLAAAWLSLTLGEPGIIHACAVHGGLDATGAAPAASAHVHGGRAGSAAGSADTSAPQHDHGGCTCLGECSGATAAVTLPATPTLAVATIAVAQPAADPVVLARPYQSPDYTLPFANGPPAATRSA